MYADNMYLGQVDFSAEWDLSFKVPSRLNSTDAMHMFFNISFRSIVQSIYLSLYFQTKQLSLYFLKKV